MKTLLLLTAINDPKWAYGPDQPRILSPFDESALELALKLREADPSTTIDVIVVGSPKDDSIVRSVIALRPDSIVRAEDLTDGAWDVAAQALRIANFVRERAAGSLPDLILTGRQFGDHDDGALPACVAELLGWSFLALIQSIEFRDGNINAVRERAGLQEKLRAKTPVLASVTNDRSNRLRHPLMKNVMTAKRAAITTASLPSQSAANHAARIHPMQCQAVVSAKRAQTCKILEGSAEDQVMALAAHLRAWQVPS